MAGEGEMVHLLFMITKNKKYKKRYKNHLCFMLSSSQAPSRCSEPSMLPVTLQPRCSASSGARLRQPAGRGANGVGEAANWGCLCPTGAWEGAEPQS